MNREAIGIILIIIGWLGVIGVGKSPDHPIVPILCSIFAFGGAWFMLSDRSK